MLGAAVMLRFAAAFGLVNLVNDKRVTRWAITRIINQRLDPVRFRTIILNNFAVNIIWMEPVSMTKGEFSAFIIADGKC